MQAVSRQRCLCACAHACRRRCLCARVHMRVHARAGGDGSHPRGWARLGGESEGTSHVSAPCRPLVKAVVLVSANFFTVTKALRVTAIPHANSAGSSAHSAVLAELVPQRGDGARQETDNTAEKAAQRPGFLQALPGSLSPAPLQSPSRALPFSGAAARSAPGGGGLSDRGAAPPRALCPRGQRTRHVMAKGGGARAPQPGRASPPSPKVTLTPAATCQDSRATSLGPKPCPHQADGFLTPSFITSISLEMPAAHNLTQH